MSYVNANTATFNGVDLTTVTGLSVLSTNNYEPPKRKLNMYNIARTHKSKINSAFYTEKNITVKVNITRATRDLLENSIDTLMGLLDDLEAPLIVKQSSGLRSYTVTYADAVVTKDGGSYAEIDLIFACSDRFGYDLAYTLLLQVTGYTSAQKTDLITLGGSAPTQTPLITLTYSAVSGGTGKNVVIGNDRTGQAVTINRTWVAGDVLEIDALNNTVKVNGTEVAYTGAIPTWKPGVGYITYGDTIVTSRTFSMTVKYYRRWK